MKHLAQLFPGGLSWRGDWPSPAPPLHVLEPPPRLQVPLPPAHPLDIAQLKPPGTRVARGESLTLQSGELAPALLAPASGRIIGASRVQLLGGHETFAVDLEVDFQDRSEGESHDDPEAAASVPPANKTDLPLWLSRLRAHGFWATRHACPDLLAQLTAALERPVDSLICSLVDSDPPLRPAAMLAQRSASNLAGGLRLLAGLVAAKHILVAVEAGAPPRWWSPFARATRDLPRELLALPHRYPQSDPSLLMHTLLRRRLRPRRLPVEQAVLLIDGAAAAAVGRLAMRRQSMLQVPLAIHDHRLGASFYLVVPLGMALGPILRQLHIIPQEVSLRCGDRLRHVPATPDAVVGGSELTVHVFAQSDPHPPQACIRCGWCDEACPVHIQPAGILEAAQRADRALAEQFGLSSCIDCGICSHVCPARLPLLDGIRKIATRNER